MEMIIVASCFPFLKAKDPLYLSGPVFLNFLTSTKRHSFAI